MGVGLGNVVGMGKVIDLEGIQSPIESIWYAGDHETVVGREMSNADWGFAWVCQPCRDKLDELTGSERPVKTIFRLIPPACEVGCPRQAVDLIDLSDFERRLLAAN